MLTDPAEPLPQSRYAVRQYGLYVSDIPEELATVMAKYRPDETATVAMWEKLIADKRANSQWLDRSFDAP